VYRVCLVEDDPNSRELLVHSMRSYKRLQLVGAYGTGEEALRQVPSLKPDVVLMDIKLPGISGIECITALRHLSPTSLYPILILTEHAEENLIIDALKAGADGYLLKRNACGKELEAAIVEVMAGGGPMSPSVAHKVIASFQSHQRKTSSNGSPSLCSGFPLTMREREVLKLVTQGFAYKQIADELDISLNTARTHLRSLYCKLNIHSRCDPRLHSVSRQHMDLRPH
jgi:DNA-binding NarL/FixJ family response regulator